MWLRKATNLIPAEMGPVPQCGSLPSSAGPRGKLSFAQIAWRLGPRQKSSRPEPQISILEGQGKVSSEHGGSKKEKLMRELRGQENLPQFLETSTLGLFKPEHF